MNVVLIQSPSTESTESTELRSKGVGDMSEYVVMKVGDDINHLN